MDLVAVHPVPIGRELFGVSGAEAPTGPVLKPRAKRGWGPGLAVRSVFAPDVAWSLAAGADVQASGTSALQMQSSNLASVALSRCG